MDESERLSTVLALQDHLQHHAAGSDLLVSSMVAATISYRRQSGGCGGAAVDASALAPALNSPLPPPPAVCTPFPKEVYPPDQQHGDKDLAALKADLAALPPARQLQDQGALSALPDRQLQLLRWLLLRATRRRVLHPLPAAQLQRLLRGRALGWEKLFACEWMRPSAVFMLEQSSEQRLECDTVLAFHGTSFENLYSILQNGLLNLTGTLMQVGGRPAAGARRAPRPARSQQRRQRGLL
jgi:hypothetical protein